MDDPAVADEKASLRDRNDIAKRGHPFCGGLRPLRINLYFAPPGEGEHSGHSKDHHQPWH